MLVASFDQEHPEKQKLWSGKTRRSVLRKPEWAKSALRRMTVQPMFTPSGLWVGNFPVLPLDRERAERSLRKIIKGLYAALHKHPFPADGKIVIFGQLCDTTRFIEQHLLPQAFSFGDDVFEWQFAQTRDGASLWKLAFYRSVVFYGLAFESTDERTGDL